MRSMNHQERHDYILKNFILCGKSYGVSKKSHDIDVIKEHHRFLWDDNDASDEVSWEVLLARRYYNKLFKEYCIADLTRHKDNKVALRWRTKEEVVTGKGQFQCGSRKCEEKDSLRSWEVNFSYQEQGERKNALVKLRLCQLHSDQLNYTSRKREVNRLKRSERHPKKSKLKMQSEKGLASYGNAVKSSSPIDTCSKPLDEEIHESDGNIWGRKPDMDIEKTSRESDFERYIEELLL